MKKILIIVNHDLVIYNFRKELVQEFIQQGFDVTIVSPYGKKIEKLTKLGCSFIDCQVDRRGTNFLNDIKLFIQYYKTIKALRPAVLLTFTVKPNLYGGLAAKINRIPYIANITGLGPAFREKGPLQIFLVFLSRIALKRAVIFFQNSENRDFFKRSDILGIENQVLPGSGVNLEEFHVLPYPDEEEICFVFIARIMKEKGIGEFLKAAKSMKEKGLKARFEVCGFFEETYYQEIFKQYQDHGIIVYHGLVEDMKEIYGNCHCVVLPSYREGLSNVILEAAACGRPAIVSDIPGCREAVENGRTGMLAVSGDPKDLTRKMEKFLKLSYKEKKEMGLLARKKMESEFDRKIVVERYMEEVRKHV